MRASIEAVEECRDVLNMLATCMDELHAHRSRLFDVKEPDLSGETLRVLTHYQFERSAAVYYLVKSRMVWDAEIVLRTVYETSAKTMFIGVQKDDVRTSLLNEFWGDLQAIYDRKGAARAGLAQKLRQRFSERDDSDGRVFDHLQDPKIFNLEVVGNKALRDKIERRWSFSEIVRELTSKSEKRVQVHGLDALLHAYGIASHIAHASPKALDLMDDRATRGEDLLALEAGHICRIASDLVLLGAFSIRFAQLAIDGSQQLADTLNNIVLRMVHTTEPLQEAFARSQDVFYAKYD